MTPDPITPEVLARLRALHAAATPGGWFRAGSTKSVVNGPSTRCIANFPSGGGRAYVGKSDPEQAVRDLRLVVAMHDALPALLDEVERLRASLTAAMELARHAEGCSAVFNTQNSPVCYPCKCGWDDVRRGIEVAK